jgi:hypothetical protein
MVSGFPAAVLNWAVSEDAGTEGDALDAQAATVTSTVPITVNDVALFAIHIA